MTIQRSREGGLHALERRLSRRLFLRRTAGLAVFVPLLSFLAACGDDDSCGGSDRAAWQFRLARGRHFFVEGSIDDAMAIICALSLPFALDAFTPYAAAALDGDPATNEPPMT